MRFSPYKIVGERLCCLSSLRQSVVPDSSLWAVNVERISRGDRFDGPLRFHHAWECFARARFPNGSDESLGEYQFSPIWINHSQPSGSKLTGTMGCSPSSDRFSEHMTDSPSIRRIYLLDFPPTRFHHPDVVSQRTFLPIDLR